MSHANQMFFVSYVKTKFPEFFSRSRVLEIGSLNINGTVRDHFSECEYVGVDIGAGPCVDVVCLGHELLYDNDSFDVVISCEAFEHDRHWEKTFDAMCRMSRKLVVFTCASTARVEHGTHRSQPETSPFTNDYYRNLAKKDFDHDKILSVFDSYEFLGVPLYESIVSTTMDRLSFIYGGSEQVEDVEDLYFWGVKKTAQ